MIRPLELTIEKFDKIVAERIREDRLRASDPHRDINYASMSVYRLFLPGTGIHEVYEIGDMGGVLVFEDIVPGFKCGVYLLVCDPKIWNAHSVREARKVIDDVAKRHNLVKMEDSTADEQMVRLAKMFGFFTEGYRENSFKRGDRLYGMTLLGKSFEEEQHG